MGTAIRRRRPSWISASVLFPSTFKISTTSCKSTPRPKQSQKPFGTSFCETRLRANQIALSPNDLALVPKGRKIMTHRRGAENAEIARRRRRFYDLEWRRPSDLLGSYLSLFL